MARTRIPYAKRATDYDEQIRILRSRGVVISDEAKAKELLSDIGYYRLGFYLHPFEMTYPLLDYRRSHDVTPETTIEDAVSLYYFDLDLRNILNRYLSRIEVAIRTTLIESQTGIIVPENLEETSGFLGKIVKWVKNLK